MNDPIYPFNNLTAVVQYRREDCSVWINMAAFDFLSVAETYALDCAESNSPWEYRAMAIETLLESELQK